MNHSLFFASWADLGIRAFVRVLPIDPAPRERYFRRRVKVPLGTCVVLGAYLNIHCLTNVLVPKRFCGVPIRRQSMPRPGESQRAPTHQYDL